MELAKGNLFLDTLWNRPILDREFNAIESLHGLYSSVELTTEEDILQWLPSKGVFTSKTCTNLLCSSNAIRRSDRQYHAISTTWAHIWQWKAPPKILLFLCKVKWNILPTHSFLAGRLRQISNRCAWCNSAAETVEHLFGECQLARWSWEYVSKWWNITPSLFLNQRFTLDKATSIYRKGIMGKY